MGVETARLRLTCHRACTASTSCNGVTWGVCTVDVEGVEGPCIRNSKRQKKAGTTVTARPVVHCTLPSFSSSTASCA